jgi:adenosylmethionine-8-amino-7-oxononanoate aminotransferase
MGTMFISEAWSLDPDAVTFGKAIAAGIYQLSGAVVKRGRDVLKANKKTVMQSHTYTATSTRAFMTATAVIQELPSWTRSISKLGEEMQYIFRYLERISQGMLVMQGQGLMWGAYFTSFGQNNDPEFRRKTIDVFKKHCNDLRILPYHVPCGGFMVTPVVDIDVGTAYEIGVRLEDAIKRTLVERAWEVVNFDNTVHAPAVCGDSGCVSHLHATKSCTNCTNFVCRDVRMRFVREV